MAYDFKAAIDNAVKSVGERAYHAIVKTVTDGLPRGFLSAEIWKTDLVSRQPSENEANASSYVALWIEEEARDAIIRLFLNREFRAALKKDWQTGHARQMAANRKKRRSLLFEEAVRATPRKATKDILRDLEDCGKIKDVGDAYLIVEVGVDEAHWERVRKSTLDSKLSRLRNT